MLLDDNEQNTQDTFLYHYGSSSDSTVPDLFWHAWSTLGAASSIGITFFNNDYQLRECRHCMEELQLFRYETASAEEKEDIRTEWQAFCSCFLTTCADSKSYCTALFGMMPINNAGVARKLASEIVRNTKTFPAKLGLSDQFIPLYQLMEETYCALIANGRAYWDEVIS